MKVKWQFYFEYEDLSFEKPHSYEVPISTQHAKAFGLSPQEFEALVTIQADEEKHGLVKQRGIIHITLPGDGKQTKDLAYSLVRSVEQHVTFSQAPIKIDGGFISNELLPETQEEAERVGENRFSWRVQVREVPDKVPFDSGAIQRLTNNRLLRQFNEANRANSPIDRFIGLFKILEDLFGGRRQKATLKASADLRRIALQTLKIEHNGTLRQISDSEFEKLIHDLVDTRNKCAHLHTPSGFGLTYGDSRVASDVEPLIEPLEILAYQAVYEKITSPDHSH